MSWSLSPSSLLGTHSLMSEIKTDQVPEFQTLFLDRMRAAHQDVLDLLGEGKINEEVTKVLEETADAIVKTLVA